MVTLGIPVVKRHEIVMSLPKITAWYAVVQMIWTDSLVSDEIPRVKRSTVGQSEI